MCNTKDKIHRLGPVINILASTLILIAVTSDAFGADANASDSNLFSMSLEQLMDVGVYAPGTITEKNPLKTPASVTTITSEDIARTPARNILDLIEIYVPGAMWVNHSTGPQLGMRGIIADRSYKFLVNLNGININMQAVYGARLELLNWDMSDIDRIEVVRGPGSVTYGPGAIAGVINIYTKSAKQNPGFEIGGAYWGKYNSKGNYVGYGRVKDDYQLYTYFSAVSTNGISPDLFATDSSGRVGYLGRAGGPSSGAGGSAVPPATYMGDFYGQPQIKALLDLHFHDDWRFWARYATESSQITQYNALKYFIDGTYRDLRESQFRYVLFVLENQRALNKNWDLKSTFRASSIDARDIQKEFGTNTSAGKVFDVNNNSKDNLQNYGYIWSENKYYAQWMLNYKPEDSKVKGAMGFEISYDTIGPAWGKNSNNGLRLGSDFGIISGPDSDAYGIQSSAGQINSSSNKYYPVGDGWHTISHAFIGELNLELSPKDTLILSGRLDKHSYTSYMFSPRLALIHEIKKDEYLKFIVQESVRMNTQEELYMNHVLNQTNFPEKLKSYELIYTKKATEHLTFESSVFYNELHAIAWDSTQRASAAVGNLRTIGLELELKYKKDNYEFGINHSYVKQISFKLGSGITNSGISNSEFDKVVSGMGTIWGNGNDLSNWSNHSTKLYTNIDLLEKKVTLHGDMEAFWGFQGYKDGLEAFEAAGGNAATVDAIQNQDAFGILVRANVSLTYHINKNADVMLFVQNIPVMGGNKRYDYNSGFSTTYPDKTSWVEEPMVVGVAYKVRF
jgi:outer membrane receptor protein involved in Fe transport